MIRWKYAIPRLVLLAVMVATLGFGLDPLLKWSLVHFGQSVTGARVGIGDSRVSWTGTKLRLADVQVADPRSPKQNLFEAGNVVFDVDPGALSRRKFVVDRGEVSGLRFGTDRDSAGTLAPSDDSGQSGPLGEDLAQRGQQWLDNAVGLMRQDLEEELESVRLSKELTQRWPAEYDRLEARAESLRQQIEQLRQMAATTRDPLQAVEAYPRVTADLQQIRRELLQLPSEASRLQQQVRSDKEAIAAAKRRDVETVRNKFRLENLDGQQLSEYLLGPNLGPPVASLLNWIQVGRKYVPSKPASLTAMRGRGEHVVFPGMRMIPDYLVRTLALQGQAEIGQRLVEFQGMATGLTTQQDVSGQPIELRVNTSGAAPMVVRAVMDRRQNTARDRLVIDCPELPQAAQILGDTDRLAVSVSPGKAHAWTSLDLRDEMLSGEIVFKQEPVELVPHLGPDLDLPSLAPRLQQALAPVKSLEVLIDVSGAVDKPRWKLRSNLGQQLAGGIQRAVGDELAARGQQLVSRAETQVAERVRRLEQDQRARHQALLQNVQLGDVEIQRIIRQLAAPLGVPEKLLGKESPLRAILQR